MKFLLSILMLLLVSIIAIKPVAAVDFVVPKDKIIVKPYDFPGIGPGDRLLFPAGTRGPIRFQGFTGAKDNPIIITNFGGKAKIDGKKTYAGIWLYGCEHIRLTGTGDAGIEYGIEVYNAKTKGVNATKYSRYFEIDHIEVYDSGGQGIYSETGDEVRDTWVQYDTYIHHNYIHDVFKEGLYIGGTSWATTKRPELKGVEISFNRVENCGWDGIQLSSAVENVSVHHNVVKNVGLNRHKQQSFGLVMFLGTTGDWYNNVVINSGNCGAYLSGKGPFNFFNNIIAHSGRHGDIFPDADGIRVTRGPANIYNNTIVDSHDDGIEIANNVTGSIHSNLIAGYSDDGIVKGSLSKNQNTVLRTVTEAYFVDPSSDNYRITLQSPAVNTGSPTNYEKFDYDGVPRPQNDIPDAGAHEYGSSNTLPLAPPRNLLIVPVD